MLQSPLSSNPLIVKANSLIETPNTLTTFEQRLVLYTTSLIQRNDEQFKEYCIDIPTFRRLIGISQSYNNKIIKTKLKHLLEKVVEIRCQDGDTEKKYILTHWLSSAEVDLGNSIIKVKIDPVLTPYLLQLKQSFTSYHLHHVIRFKNKHSFKVYELLKQYEKISKRSVCLSELKYFLGIGPSQYASYKNLKSKVLRPVQQEIARKSDITFHFKHITRQRKVVGIVFSIKKKEISQNVAGQITSLLELLPKQHQGKQSIEKMLVEYSKGQSHAYVIRNIHYTNKNCRGNYRVYLQKSLEHDWGVVWAEDEVVKMQRLKEHQLQQQEFAKQEQQKQQEQENQKMLVVSSFNKLHKKKKSEITKLMESQQNEFIKKLPWDIRVWMFYEDNQPKFKQTNL